MPGTQMQESATDDMPSKTAYFAAPTQPVLCCRKQLLFALLITLPISWALIIGKPKELLKC